MIEKMDESEKKTYNVSQEILRGSCG